MPQLSSDNIAFPLEIGAKGFRRFQTDREAIDAYLGLLLTTAQGSCVIEPRFGFAFNNARFENFDEAQGVIYSAQNEKTDADGLPIYDKKVSGTSRSVDTFASVLKESIERYEHRLCNINVVMTYVREERTIYVVVQGKIAQSGEDYQYQNTIKVWS